MTKRIQGFGKAVLKSCYDMEFYRTVRAKGPGAAFLYLAALYALFAVLGSVMFVPAAVVARGKFAAHVAAVVPDGARFALTKGQLETNVDMPLSLGVDGFPVTLDTRVSLADKDKVASGLLFGKDGAILVQGKKTDDVPYSGIPDFVATRESIMQKIGAFTAVVAGIVAALIVFLWAGATLLGGVLQALLLAGAAWVIAKLADKARLTYKQWLATALHALTLPALLSLLFGNTIGRVPLLTAGIFMLIALAVARDERENPSGAPAPVEPPTPDGWKAE